jgi:hypothetical protein
VPARVYRDNPILPAELLGNEPPGGSAESIGVVQQCDGTIAAPIQTGDFDGAITGAIRECVANLPATLGWTG